MYLCGDGGESTDGDSGELNRSIVLVCIYLHL